MLIAGPNRKIVRLKLPEIGLIAAPTAIVAAVAGTALAFVMLHDRYEQVQAVMQSDFAARQKQLQLTIAGKDSELQLLQSSLIDFTQQAEQFQAKVDEIKQLKQVLAVMTGSDDAAAGNNAAKSSPPAASSAKPPAAHSSPSATLPMGGDDLSPTPDDVARTIADTKSSMSSVISDMNGLMTSLTESEAELEEAQHVRDITPTLWPTPSHTVSSGFGIRYDPFTEQPAMHAGIDFAGRTNDPIYATAEGKVTEAGYDSTHGNHVTIRHGNGLETAYLHMSKLLVKPGQTVKKGEQIGLMGTTGRSTGTHLHYEVHRGGVAIDPRPYLLANRKESVEP
jgi:murein DD-endopeptidase MepM/ murein hydrolase activator NlpD